MDAWLIQIAILCAFTYIAYYGEASRDKRQVDTLVKQRRLKGNTNIPNIWLISTISLIILAGILGFPASIYCWFYLAGTYVAKEFYTIPYIKEKMDEIERFS